MRLVLSSWFLTPESDRPAALPRGGRAGIVLNALDDRGASRDRDLARERRTFEGLGFTCEELDLRDHFTSPQDLPARLADLDLVWALGGNAFVLARAVTQAGLLAALHAQAGRPEFTYGGYSAGACVTGPDLRGIDLIDDPDVLPDGYPPTAEPRCLGLIPYRIVPHWRSDHPESEAAGRAATYLTDHGLAHRCLRDGETVSITDVEPPPLAAGRHSDPPSSRGSNRR